MGRDRPEKDRGGHTRKVTLGQAPNRATSAANGRAGEKVDFYITVNRYPDDRPCEVFTKATNGYQGWCDAICRLVSLLLQNGVDTQTICRQLQFAHFAPFGRVTGFGFARSFVDFLVRGILTETKEKEGEDR